MYTTKRLLFGLAALLMTVSLMGCAAVVVGGAAATAAYVYENGWLERNYQANLDQSYAASKLALQDLGITLTEETKSIADAELKGDYNGQKVWVDLEEIAPTTTTIGVRVSALGDRAASEKIHEALDRRL